MSGETAAAKEKWAHLLNHHRPLPIAPGVWFTAFAPVPDCLTICTCCRSKAHDNVSLYNCDGALTGVLCFDCFYSCPLVGCGIEHETARQPDKAEREGVGES